jgi:hypothetical protein
MYANKNENGQAVETACCAIIFNKQLHEKKR